MLLMRLFEGDIKTDSLISTYCSVSKKHFYIIFLSKVIDNLIPNCDHLGNKLSRYWQAKLLICTQYLLKMLKTTGLKHYFLSLID